MPNLTASVFCLAESCVRQIERVVRAVTGNDCEQGDDGRYRFSNRLGISEDRVSGCSNVPYAHNKTVNGNSSRALMQT